MTTPRNPDLTPDPDDPTFAASRPVTPNPASSDSGDNRFMPDVDEGDSTDAELTDERLEKLVTRTVMSDAPEVVNEHSRDQGDIHPDDAEPLLKLKDLEVTFTTSTGKVPAAVSYTHLTLPTKRIV